MWDNSVVREKAWFCGCSSWLFDAWDVWKAGSFKNDCVRGLLEENVAKADEFQAFLGLKWVRADGNDVKSQNDCCVVLLEIGDPELALVGIVWVSVPRNEEGVGKTVSTLSLAFLCRFGPCFLPDALVSTLSVVTDESPPLIFCPSYQLVNLSRAPSFSVTATMCEHICFGLKFLHVHVALKFGCI